MKKNAYNCPIIESMSNNYPSRRVGIPTGAIKEAGFNTKYPIYIQQVGTNHLGLTQDGSMPNLIGQINGWTVRGGKAKQYMIGAKKNFDESIDFVTVMPFKKDCYIDLIGVSYGF